MSGYEHIRDGAVDWAHHDGIMRADWARRSEYDVSIVDAVALDEAGRIAERSVVEAGTFVRAYTSTRRAIELEDRDRRESESAVWRERRAVTS